ncbi:MAG: TIGR03862 family flavoprotein [Bacteroidetes bacterium]|nr:TIGR03862 family flavoprotein [Bacteroidota bacterium]
MKKTIAIIGSGPSALLLAATLDQNLFDITIYERKAAPARKFLVAGDGGFNLTHSEEREQFISRYTPKIFLADSIRSFTNTDLRNWLKDIGIDTYVGTSKRVFPVKGIKPIDVLNAILNELKKKHVTLLTEYTWKGWNSNNELIFEHDKKEHFIKAGIVVFALGGASWSITGSDGSWTNLFEQKRITIVPFQPSNCAYKIEWDKKFRDQAEGSSLKNITITCDNVIKKGELVITQFGLEGGAIYGLSPQIRKQLNENNTAVVFIDLKPDFTKNEIKNKLRSKGNRSYTKQLKDELNLNDVQIALLKTILTKEEFVNPLILADKIKHLPLKVAAMAPIDEAISTVGGISPEEVDEYFQLKKLPSHFCIGEMLDWDAPTGGYLLQACFSMGNYLGKYLNSN